MMRGKRKSSRDLRLRRKFGITEEQWIRLYKLQNGKCPICDKPLYMPGNKKGLRAAAVEHNHKTGAVRGLTCISCNRFKIAKNTVESAYRVMVYLTSDFDARLI